MIQLESRRKAILEAQEVAWRLENRAIWNKGGDENKIFFQAYAKGRKMCNTIWNLLDEEGGVVSNFDCLTSLS